METSKRASPNENLNPAEMDGRHSRKRGNLQEPQTPVKAEPAAESDNVPNKKNRAQTSRDELAVAGRVSKVHLQNFMCHANLGIDFDTRNCNCFYIGGPNGSGKSALFAAINIGLGGRGSDNDRGNSVKSYIKDGTTSGKVSITLTNEGLNSHPDYGEQIVIERNITQSSSTYTLKSVTGFGRNMKETVVSKKKSDVDRMVSRFNIHLSNPAFWMSQDRSRSFLANFKPGSVYKLYQEATNLDRIKMSYARFAGVLEELALILGTKREELSKKTKELKRLQEIRQLHEKLAEDQKDIELFQWNLLFCSIRDMNDELEITKDKLVENERLTAENKTKMLDNRQKRMDVMRKVEDIMENMEEMKEDVDGVKDELHKAKQQMNDDEQDINQIGKEIKNKQAQISMIHSRIKSAKLNMRTLMQKTGNDELKARLEKCEKKYDECRDQRANMEESGQIVDLKERKDEAEKTLKQRENETYDLRREISEMEKRAEACKEKLRRSQAVKVNKINKFGARMSEIVHEMQRQKNRFEQMPKGPVGKYVSIIDSKWSYPIEECIGQMASQFLCHSSHDADVMRKIFETLRLHPQEKPNLIVSRFLGRPHGNLMEPDKKFQTVYRMLKIEDNDIHNAIIDKANAESVLLLENNRDAMQYMDSSRPPANVTKAYTIDGSQAFVGGPGGQYRFYAGKRGQPRGLFDGADERIDESELRTEISDIEKDVRSLKERGLAQAEEAYRNAKKEHAATMYELKKFEKSLADVRADELRYERQVRDIQVEIENEDGQEEMENLKLGIEDHQQKIPVIEAEIEELKERKEAATEKMQPMIVTRDKLQKELSVHMEEVDVQRAKLDEVRAIVTTFDREYDKLDSVKTRYESSKQALYNEDLQLKVRKDDIIKVVDTKKVSITRPPGAGDPPDLSDFPPTDQAQRIYKDKIRRIEIHKEGVDENVTMEMVQEFKDSLKKEKAMCRRIYEALECLNDVLKRRVQVFPMLKKCTEMKVRNKFKELLDIRGNFVGDLDIDNEKQTLNVRVNSCKEKDAGKDGRRDLDEDPEDDDDEDTDDFIDEDGSDEDEPRRKKKKPSKKNQKKKKTVRDLKGLSGGERSFVTAALVMALWEVMDQPFRMMDEFDVFMDMMNRKVVMDLLVSLATEKFPHNQFIFFTPQGIKELKKVDGLQIFEMNKVRD